MRKSNRYDPSDIVFYSAISPSLRTKALAQSELNCQMCGLEPGEIDSTTGRKARLQIGQIMDKSLGEKDEISNLSVACSICEEGRKNITTERPTALWLLSQVRRAGREEQLAVLNWLHSKFEKNK